jgi:hypothetical protein
VWWPWSDLDAARDPLVRGERELLSQVMAVASRATRSRLSLAELDQVLGVTREPIADHP